MNCLRLNAKRKCLVLSKSEIPKVEKDNEMIVKVALAGVCGTDLHIIEVRKSFLKTRYVVCKADEGIDLVFQFYSILRAYKLYSPSDEFFHPESMNNRQKLLYIQILRRKMYTTRHRLSKSVAESRADIVAAPRGRVSEIS